jgi:inositol-hexakisphosphate kinase
LYFPHERASDEVETFPPLEDDPDRPQSSHTFAQGCMGLPDQEISHVDISLRSRHDSSILHGDFQTLQGPLSDPDDKSLATLSEYSSESDVASTDGSTLSTREEESSLTDEAELTPTATPTQRQRCFRPRRKHTSPSTIRAVELKPYRHQVGGHTTVFRFSRRAVCKQLNNRENEFYERIERRHPEMLMFLPRFVKSIDIAIYLPIYKSVFHILSFPAPQPLPRKKYTILGLY